MANKTYFTKKTSNRTGKTTYKYAKGGRAFIAEEIDSLYGQQPAVIGNPLLSTTRLYLDSFENWYFPPIPWVPKTKL